MGAARMSYVNARVASRSMPRARLLTNVAFHRLEYVGAALRNASPPQTSSHERASGPWPFPRRVKIEPTSPLVSERPCTLGWTVQPAVNDTELTLELEHILGGTATANLTADRMAVTDSKLTLELQ